MAKFADADPREVLNSLTLNEKIQLLSGKDFWRTTDIKRVGIPSIKTSDGPNGARGGSFLSMTPAQALPAGTGLGATFNTDLVYEVGKVIGNETKARAAACLLGPTINIQRSPLNGRAFESYSEDGTVSGNLAASFVNGVQETGVAATIKHFVCNDMEHERNAVDVHVSARALREVYLLPFQIVQAKAKPKAWMTNYGRVNGTHVSENPFLLKQVLRDEWGVDGLIMSDWFGTYSVDSSINASMDLEMPGPARWRTEQLVKHLVLNARKIKPKTIDDRALTVIKFVQNLAKTIPDVVYGPDEERTLSDPASRALARQAAVESTVLLKNSAQILPISSSCKSIAVIGPSAKTTNYCGGGSAELGAAFLTSAYDGLLAGKPNKCDLSYSVGTWAHSVLPRLDNATCMNDKGDAAWSITIHESDGENKGKTLAEFTLTMSLARLIDALPSDVMEKPYFAVLSTNFTADLTGPYEFGLITAGRGRFYVDDKLIIDNWANTTKGTEFFGCGTNEVPAVLNVEQGRVYKLRVDYSSVSAVPGETFLMSGIRLGGFPVLDADQEIAKAVELAKTVDVPIVFVGLNSEWESENFDRPNLDLPLRTNELVLSVARANPKTVVVVQTGSAVTMPWADEVSTIIWQSYGGNDFGHALADVIFGKQAPSGRLPITFPRNDQDVPAFADFRSEMGHVHYSEGLNVGYKHYLLRNIPPLFPFGHGLSYTKYKYTDLSISTNGSNAETFRGIVELTVENVGDIASARSILAFFVPPQNADPAALSQPERSLRAFSKTKVLAPGERTIVEIPFDKYAISHWNDYDTDKGAWDTLIGEWTVSIQDSADPKEVLCFANFTLSESFIWRGL